MHHCFDRVRLTKPCSGRVEEMKFGVSLRMFVGACNTLYNVTVCAGGGAVVQSKLVGDSQALLFFIRINNSSLD